MISALQVDRLVDVPWSCPQVSLRAKSSLLVAAVRVNLGEALRVRWLGMQIVKMAAPTGAPDPVKLSSNMGLCYAGIYSGDFSDVTRPAGSSLVQFSLNQVSVRQMSPHYFRSFTSPDTYALIITNNTLNLDFEVVVTGAARLYPL